MASGIYLPDHERNLCLLHWGHGVSATGHQGRSSGSLPNDQARSFAVRLGIFSGRYSGHFFHPYRPSSHPAVRPSFPSITTSVTCLGALALCHGPLPKGKSHSCLLAQYFHLSLKKRSRQFTWIVPNENSCGHSKLASAPHVKTDSAVGNTAKQELYQDPT